jgi:ABC-2 type transport system ATP-binding protein
VQATSPTSALPHRDSPAARRDTHRDASCYTMTAPMIAVEGLSKTYNGTSFAVRGVSFHVDKGEVVGFLGPNGAGKSTTLRVVAGFLGATSGKVALAGHDLERDPLRARAAVGYMPEAVPLYPEMRVREYLRFRAELKGVGRAARRANVQDAMERGRVADVAEQLIGHLSKGYRQRVGLADALVARPPILILDEPTAGLDPNQIREVRALVRELGREQAVLLSTHILSEVEATCDRALVISKGRLVAEGRIDELHKLSRSQGLRIGVDAIGPAAEVLAKIDSLEKLEVVGSGVLLAMWKEGNFDQGSATSEVARALVGAGIGLRELAPVKASLEQVFAELTRDGPT